MDRQRTHQVAPIRRRTTVLRLRIGCAAGVNDNARNGPTNGSPRCNVRMKDALFSELETHTAHVTADLPALIDASIAVAQDEQPLGAVQACQAGDQGERARKRSRSIQTQRRDTPSDRRIPIETTIVQNDIPTHSEFIYRTRGESSSPETPYACVLGIHRMRMMPKQCTFRLSWAMTVSIATSICIVGILSGCRGNAGSGNVVRHEIAANEQSSRPTTAVNEAAAANGIERSPRDIHPVVGAGTCIEMYSACKPSSGDSICTSAPLLIECGEAGKIPPTGELLRCVCP